MISCNDESGSLAARSWDQVKAKVVEKAVMIKKIGKDDPRRIIHSLKVGLALTLVSSLYYVRPLYDGFGEAGMSGILTVVVVFEFTVGGTISKSFNRGCATLVAGALGLGTAHLSTLGGDQGRHVIIGVLVFILATVATFARFFPDVRSKYDYGVMIFILTFSLVAVSGSRATEILQLAYQRLTTILIGVTTCIVISIFVCPVWAGLDLNNIVAGNMEKLAHSLQGIGNVFVTLESYDTRSFLIGYKTVLNSKAVEESLANFSSWEPFHGGFRFGHPWKQYLKIGNLNRDCAIHIGTLERYMIDSKPDDQSTGKIYTCLVANLDNLVNGKNKTMYQFPSELYLNFYKPCATMTFESGKALEELSYTIKNMRFSSSLVVAIHIQNSKAAVDDLKTNIMLENLLLPKHDLQETMQLLLVASALVDIIKCVENISVSVNELAQNAHFKNSSSAGEEISKHRCDIEENKDRVTVHIPGVSGE